MVLAALVMALEARAGPGSWKTIRQGLDPEKIPAAAWPAGNARTMELRAGTAVTRVRALAITDPFSANQDGCAQADADAWFTLRFCGSAQATGHCWEINTKATGLGFIQAGADFAGSSSGQSMEVLEFTGDNTNGIVAQLSATDSGAAGFTFTIPPEFSLSAGGGAAGNKHDVYDLSEEVTSMGGGQVCRVRVSTYAKARVAAKCTLGAATVGIDAGCWGEIIMTGFCRVAGLLYKDEFRLFDDISDDSLSGMEAPSGGIETDSGPPPPDTPTEEERAGETPPSDQDAIPNGGVTETPETPAPDEEGSSTDTGGTTSPDSGGTTEGG